MTLQQGLGLLTWSGELLLAVLCLSRARSDPLARPLAALCAVIAVWTFAEWAYAVTGSLGWAGLDVTLSPLTMPAAVYFILAFVGARRRLRWVFVATAVPFGLLSLACASGFVSAWGQAFARTPLRGQIQGALIVPAVVAGAVLLVRHDRAHADIREKVRTRLVIAALVIGGLLGAADVLGATLPVPSMLVTTGLLALVALRLSFFHREPSRLLVVYALAVVATGMLGYHLAFRIFPAREVVLGLALLAVTLGLGAAVAQLVAAAGDHRARVERLAVLGQLSSQLAHDVKNPLASIKGAAQVLQAELDERGSLQERAELLALMVAETERLVRLTDRYLQLGRLEPERRPLDLNALAQRVATLRGIGLPEGVVLELESVSDLPPCQADGDLIEAAVDNLVTNAVEAVGERGRIVLATARAADDVPAVQLTVVDDGPGMNARDQERAFDELVTTKARGSGLGLPFARRVAEAHGGRLVLTGREGVGTEAKLVIPVEP